MPVKIVFNDNSDKVQTQMEGNKERALEAMGIKGVNLVLWQMRQGYGKTIRQTGNLQRDVSFAVENSGPDTVDVGNTLEYGPYVHEGTSKMAARPYLRDALTGESHQKQLQKVAEAALKEGFDQ